MQKKTRKQIENAHYNTAVTRKAAKLNKLLADKKIERIEHKGHDYKLTYKNGQIFKFTFYPESLFGTRTIIPILKEDV